MENTIAASFLSSAQGTWPRPAQAAQALPDAGAGKPAPLAPPDLGAAPGGARVRALALSVAVYGGLLGTGLTLAWSSPAKAEPRRTVALVLDTFEPGPPPPAAGPAGGTAAPAGAAPPVAVPEPDRSAGAVLPLVEPTLATAGTPKDGHGLPGGGVEGGQVNGTPGGVPGGQAGGTEGGQVGAIAPPRFDAVYLQNPEPEYPGLSRRLGEEGRVLLRVLVSAEGLPEQVELRQSSGHPRLDQAALGTVRRWRFTPARRGSERLAAWVVVPLSFRLD